MRFIVLVVAMALLLGACITAEAPIDPGEREFTSISTGASHACGIQRAGTLFCWGGGEAAKPPSGKFTSVDAGGFAGFLLGSTCGIRIGGSLECWGVNRLPFGLNGQFVAVSVGSYEACALKADGTPLCWHPYGLEEAPPGPFTSVDALGESGAGCGLRPDGMADCWRRRPEGPEGLVIWSVGEFVAMSASGGAACGIRPDATLTCWTSRNFSGPPSTSDPFPLQHFRQVSVASETNICAVREDDTLVCWGLSALAPPAGAFLSVSTGDLHSCGIRVDGTAACWGRTYYPDVSGGYGGLIVLLCLAWLVVSIPIAVVLRRSRWFLIVLCLLNLVLFWGLIAVVNATFTGFDLSIPSEAEERKRYLAERDAVRLLPLLLLPLVASVVVATLGLLRRARTSRSAPRPSMESTDGS